MKHRNDVQILSLLEQKYVHFLNEKRDRRNIAKQNILKIQENQRYYNRHRKKACIYKEDDLVTIRSRFENQGKVFKALSSIADHIGLI